MTNRAFLLEIFYHMIRELNSLFYIPDGQFL
jgi:hypothetical protein